MNKFRFSPTNEGQDMNLVSIQSYANLKAALAKASQAATSMQGFFPDASISIQVISQASWNKGHSLGYLAQSDGRFIDEATGEYVEV